MKRTVLHVLVPGLLLLAASGWAYGAPPRILIQPPYPGAWPGIEKSRPDIVRQCLALYLYDWLGREPGVRLVDEDQATRLFNDMNDPAITRRAEDNILQAVRDRLEVDGAVTWDWSEGVLTLQLRRTAGVVARDIPWRAATDAAAALKAGTDWLASELGVGTKTSPLARGLRVDDQRFIEDYYMAERYQAKWFDNTGVEQLKIIRPHLERLAQDPWAANAIVRAGAMMTRGAKIEKPEGHIIVVMQSLPRLLGTEWEPTARHFCEVNKSAVATVEKELLNLIRNSGKDEVDALLDADATPARRLLDADEEKGGPEAGDGARALEQQAGALRCLGEMQSKGALALYPRVARAQDARLRRATARALAHYAAPAGAAELDTLRRDADAATAFLAAWALSRRGQAPDDLVRRAVVCLKDDLECEEALETLASKGTAAEMAPLRAFLSDPRGKRRALAVAGLSRSGALDAAAFQAAVGDPDGAVIRAAIERLPGPVAETLRGRLVVLAHHPDENLAEKARERLAAMAPTGARERRQFELAMEHPYVRGQRVEALARDNSPEALADLEQATMNSDAHTRALALGRLAGKAPARARPHAIRLIADPHRWVRLHAAAVAARVSEAPDAAALKQALDVEQDKATRLYLEDALARAEGKPPPVPPPGVNRVSAEKTMPFLVGHGADCVNSPFQGYYDLAYKPDEPAQKAHAAGKVFLVRANKTAKNPTQVFFDIGWRDGFWLGLDAEFGDLAAVDGIVLGEESLYFRQWEAWEPGWRLFCREAGIDPRRVAGDREQLSASEKQAWWNWEQRVAIEGFNAMGAWIKLAYGKLRPGFQVCTFMPDQNGPCDFDREWKFDVGAGYYYETGNRHRYTQIRRFKTMWPDRPVIWLYDGVPAGLYAGLNYQFKPLTSPLQNPGMPSYADALCAWMAGAQPGCYYGRLAVDPRNMKRKKDASGTWVFIEDISASLLPRVMDRVFDGVSGLNDLPAAAREGSTLPPSVDLERDLPADKEFELEGKGLAKDLLNRRVAAEKEAMTLGLFLEQKMAYDVARLLAGLPPPAATNDVLLVGDEDATRGALRLPQRYDYLDHVNKLAGADLARYRFIGVANADRALLRDDALRAVAAWLRDTPGLLYVQGWLPTSATNEAATVTDRDGRLEAEWPWAKAVALDGQAYRIVGTGATAPGIGAPGTVLLWQEPGFKGAVLFDQSALAPEELRKALNRLQAERRIGVAFDGPIGMERAELAGVAAAAACGAGPTTPFALPGTDLLTGIVEPVLTKARGAAFVAREYQGRYVAAHGGVAVLCEKPIASVTPLDDGLEVDGGGGLMQAVSAGGTVEVRAGMVLPVIAGDKVLPWLLSSREPGEARVAREPSAGVTTYLRAPGKVTLRRR